MPPTPVAVPSSTASQSATPKPSHPDLITRYNLHDKLKAEEAEEAESGQTTTKQGWSQDKSQRQSLMQKRREEMILAARRKMEAKLKAEQEAKGNAAAQS
jgi:coupling of ubiquitin conjugation to ER degradation protein 1